MPLNGPARSAIGRLPGARSLNQLRTRRDLGLLDAMPAFAPYSAGPAEFRSQLCVEAAGQTPNLLASLAHEFGHDLPVIDAEAFAASRMDAGDAEELGALFATHQSDKSTRHDYHVAYAPLLTPLRGQATAVVEIGLGTTDSNVVSSMGPGGRPGASLRAFRDFFPKAQVYGGDVDTKILFEEDRIRTHHVDQTDDASVDGFEGWLPEGLDVVIDDGLHSPNANLRVLRMGLRLVKPGGCVIIEDINPAAHGLWQAVAPLMPDGWTVSYVRAKLGDLFIVERPRQ